MEDRFSAPFCPAFHIELKNEKKVGVASLEELLKLDNTIKNPVKKLIIFVQEPGLDCGIVFESGSVDNIAIDANGDDAKVVGELFAEVEEQVERTLDRGWIVRVLGWKAGFGIAALLLLSLGLMFTTVADLAGRTGTRAGDAVVAGEFVKSANSASTLDEKVNWLFEYQKRNAELLAGRQAVDLDVHFTWANFFLILPIGVAIGCLGYMAIWCYPRVVFLWGDWEDYYKAIVGKRRAIWAVVLGALLVGVMSSLFADSLQAALSKK